MKLESGFEGQKQKQSELIAQTIFNMHRYSKMSDKKLREECGGASNIPENDKLRTYVMSKEVRDIIAYQANIKLLEKLSKNYGEKDSKGSLIADLQRDFGITASTEDK